MVTARVCLDPCFSGSLHEPGQGPDPGRIVVGRDIEPAQTRRQSQASEIACRPVASSGACRRRACRPRAARTNPSARSLPGRPGPSRSPPGASGRRASPAASGGARVPGSQGHFLVRVSLVAGTGFQHLDNLPDRLTRSPWKASRFLWNMFQNLFRVRVRRCPAEGHGQQPPEEVEEAHGCAGSIRKVTQHELSGPQAVAPVRASPGQARRTHACGRKRGEPAHRHGQCRHRQATASGRGLQRAAMIPLRPGSSFVSSRRHFG